MATVNVTGNFQTITSSAVVSGTVQFVLQNYGTNIPRVSGVTVLVTTSTTVSTDNAGHFTVNLYGNDTITPTNTYYQAIFKDANGVAIGTANYRFNGAGPFDLDTFAPNV